MIETIESRNLLKETAHILHLTDSERIAAVWELKNVWIPYPFANSIFRKAQELLDRPVASRMPCILAYGDPNLGKTRMLQEYLKRHPIDPSLDGDASRALVMELKSRALMKVFFATPFWTQFTPRIKFPIPS